MTHQKVILTEAEFTGKPHGLEKGGWKGSFSEVWNGRLSEGELSAIHLCIVWYIYL